MNITIAEKLTALLAESVAAEEVPTALGTLQVYYSDELAGTYHGGAFFSLIFEAMGQEFTLFARGELVEARQNDDGGLTGVLVVDPKLIELLEDYLAWRLRVLQAKLKLA